MDANTMAIVVLLGSFFLMVLLRFPKMCIRDRVTPMWS